MVLRTLTDLDLERRLNVEPDNLKLILEAARRFPRTAERADDADQAEEARDEAKSDHEEAKTQADNLRDELSQAEAHADELQKELDQKHEEYRTNLVEAHDKAEALRKENEKLAAEVARLTTVLELVADA